MGFFLRALHRPLDALYVDEEAIALRRALAETNPAITKDLGFSVYSLAYDLRALDCPNDAIEPDKEAIVIWRGIAATDPAIVRGMSLKL
jgi:hypothetical protein